MLAKLIKANSQLKLLYPDGTTSTVDNVALWRLFTGFKQMERFTGSGPRWDMAYLDMEDVPGHILAFVDDERRLVIVDSSPFNNILAGVATEEYLTAAEYAESLGKSVGRIKQMCQAGRIAGAIRKGGQWLIPEHTEYPVDARTYAKKK